MRVFEYNGVLIVKCADKARLLEIVEAVDQLLSDLTNGGGLHEGESVYFSGEDGYTDEYDEEEEL